ncbi:DNA topoisomerase IB [Sphingopyxis sp. RIFCSPHIGHO2_12_FULL_65_19]|uniref:DNA topoisomerase IB n=1 Tax=Sphingopyxis sp. RIFCSPHIGHO2_12_FULL_65_19 TaxID=1802172 RepID=UPI0008D493DF|nr:DNA topoisomerase IB [Sphingopyxis sp. RIFCSPHIGHO2_12_FULL_65_19]OHD10108.1 MAG: DNA topoisomerase [Sphingopyxis sp. RIFCSPHIGHO2_12_FULL_65_19]
MSAPRLVHVDDSLPGISRERSGTGWRYRDAKGRIIRERDEIDRLNAIALPPAYEDAWFCPAPNGHILATGYDARGRKQYRYHPDFRIAREADKYDRCAAFGHALPLLRARLADDLNRRTLCCERVVAAVVRLLDLAALRIGNEQYVAANKSFGATTLRQRHAKLAGRTLRLNYVAKGGARREVTISDRSLSTLVRRLQDLPGQKLFQYVDGDDVCAVGSDDVNAYIRDAMGNEFSAKHFRTWSASVEAFAFLYDAPEPPMLKAMLERVASRLGNTPAIARKAYIHPAMLAAAQRGEDFSAAIGNLPRATRYLSRYERGFLTYLEQAPAAAVLLQSA